MTDINITAPATVAVTMADASGSQTVTFTTQGGVIQPPTGKTPWGKNPGGDGTWWKLPVQTNMVNLWERSGSRVNSLRSGRGSVAIGSNGQANWSTPYVEGTENDPLVTVVDQFGHSMQVRIPVGTTSANMGDVGDNSLGGVDLTQPYRVWTINNACVNAPLNGGSGSIHSGSDNFINCSYFGIFDGTGPLMMDAVTGLEWQTSDNAFGSITDAELTAARLDPNFVLQHMLVCLLDISQCSPTPTWPVRTADAQASGTIPEGSLIGIPADVPMPAGLSRGGKLLWANLQQFGWMPYNDGETGGIRSVLWVIDPANWAIAQDIANSYDEMRQYLCLYTGSTSFDNMKGMVNGQRSDAFPAAPPLDYSPTGGAPVQPSSFGAWFGSMNNGTTSGIFYPPA